LEIRPLQSEKYGFLVGMTDFEWKRGDVKIDFLQRSCLLVVSEQSTETREKGDDKVLKTPLLPTKCAGMLPSRGR